MDVTSQIIRNNQVYGASDFTGAHTLSASRSLNYAKGASIVKPAVEKLNVIPYTLNYQDAVGLFGAENHFVRIDVEEIETLHRVALKSPGTSVQR